MKWITTILEKKVFLLMALFVAALFAVLFFQKNCGGGYESKEYLELKGQFNAHKAQAEQKERALQALEEITTKGNAALRDKVNKLEIEKGGALADVADVRKEMWEKDRELENLREREAEIEDLPELVLNLREQNLTLENTITLKDKVALNLTGALQAANKQIVGLEEIIFKKDELIKGMWVALAAERVARMACEDVVKVGEKNTFWNKIGKLAGKGFQIYGIYSAGRDIIKAAK